MIAWIAETKTPTGESYPDRLRREADELDRHAEQLKGCSWLGEPPWQRPMQDATDKRLLAALLEQNLKQKET